MNSLTNLAKKELTPRDKAKIEMGEVLCHNGGGLVSFDRDGPICSCGKRVIKLESSSDPGSVVCCESVFETYQLPEEERRAIKPATYSKPRIITNWRLFPGWG